MRKYAAMMLLVVGASIAIPVLGHAGEETATIPTGAVTGSDTYLLVDASNNVSVWSESNGLAGLQTHDTNNPDGSVTPKDTQDL